MSLTSGKGARDQKYNSTLCLVEENSLFNIGQAATFQSTLQKKGLSTLQLENPGKGNYKLDLTQWHVIIIIKESVYGAVKLLLNEGNPNRIWRYGRFSRNAARVISMGKQKFGNRCPQSKFNTLFTIPNYVIFLLFYLSLVLSIYFFQIIQILELNIYREKNIFYYFSQ